MDLLGTDQQRGNATVTGEDDRGQLLKHGNRRERKERGQVKKTGATQVQHKQSQSESVTDCDTTGALSWPLFSLLCSRCQEK